MFPSLFFFKVSTSKEIKFVDVRKWTPTFEVRLGDGGRIDWDVNGLCVLRAFVYHFICVCFCMCVCVYLVCVKLTPTFEVRLGDGGKIDWDVTVCVRVCLLLYFVLTCMLLYVCLRVACVIVV